MSEEKKTYIPGIYNYCDRWCEKCEFTSNCYLFTTESRITSHQILNNGELPEADDIFKAEDFADSDEIINEEEDFFVDNEDDYFDIDDELSQEDYEEYIQRKRSSLEENKTLLEELTKEYLDKSHKLVKAIDKKDNLSQPPKENLEVSFTKNLYNNFEIFCYYHMFIHVKFKRAIHGKIDLAEEDDDEMKEISKDDMNGSAKVATISVNNSIAALNELFGLLPEYIKEIGELLVLLGKIKNEAEKEFPDCMSFKRPGLDR